MKRLLKVLLVCSLVFANHVAVTESARAALPTWACGAGYFQFYPERGPYNVPTPAGWALGSRLCTATVKTDIVATCPTNTTLVSYKVQPSLEVGRSAEIRRNDIYSWVITSPPDLRVTVNQTQGVTYKSNVSVILVWDQESDYYSERQWVLPQQYGTGGTVPGQPDAKAKLYTLREYREFHKWQRICLNSSKMPVKIVSRNTDLVYLTPGSATGTPVWREEMAAWNGEVHVVVKDTTVVPPKCPASSNNLFPADKNWIRVPKNSPRTHGSNASSSWGLSLPIGNYGNVGATSGATGSISITWTNENKLYPRTICVATSTARNFTNFPGFGSSEKTPGLVIGVTTQR